jgi:DNA repair photolyase
VSNALDLLESELPKYIGKINFVHLSFMTDPFMYDAVNRRTIPWIKDMTLKIIRRLNEEDIKVTVLTKGLLLAELKKKKYHEDNEYGITLTSMDSKFHERFEPYSITPKRRLNALKRLHDAGLKTWVSIEPYPTPNIVKQNLDNILQEISFVDKIIFGKWNYSPLVNGYETSKKFYTQASDTVIQFCKMNNIQYHIKEGTPRNSHKTQDLFHD